MEPAKTRLPSDVTVIEKKAHSTAYTRAPYTLWGRRHGLYLPLRQSEPTKLKRLTTVENELVSATQAITAHQTKKTYHGGKRTCTHTHATETAAVTSQAVDLCTGGKGRLVFSSTKPNRKRRPSASKQLKPKRLENQLLKHDQTKTAESVNLHT